MAALTLESLLPWWPRAIWESVEEQWETAWISAWGTHLVHSRDLTRCTACGLASCLAALRSLPQFFKMLLVICVDVFFWEFRFNSCDWFHEMHNMSMWMISCAAAPWLCQTLVMCRELAHHALCMSPFIDDINAWIHAVFHITISYVVPLGLDEPVLNALFSCCLPLSNPLFRVDDALLFFTGHLLLLI